LEEHIMEQAVQLERRVRVIPATRQPTARGPRHDGKRRVAAYCRVSTDSEEQLNSYDAQKSYYTQRIEENPDWELAGIFADEGITGTSMKKRTEFKRMIAACKRGRIDMILTKSLSRFARNTVDCLDTVRVLKANGIGVIFEKENINTLTESSEFLITLFSGFAQAESESLSKNVRQGKQFGMKDGIVHFQYKKLLGYRRGEDGQPEIVPEEAETIRRIYRRYLEGASEGEIKKELEADNIPTAAGLAGWSHRVVHSILTNEKYIGDALLQKTYVTDCISKKVVKNQGELPMYYIENHHPGIIPKELFQRVQEEMARRTSKRKVMQKTGKTEQGKYSAKYALSELLICGECGTPYKRCTWSRNGKKRIVWRCVSRLEYGTKYCHNSPTLDEGKLHDAIVAALNRYGADRAKVIEDALAIAEIVQSHGSKDGVSLLALQDRLKELSAEQDALLDKVLADMGNSELNTQLKALAEEKQDILDQMAAHQQDEKQQILQASRQRERDEWLEQQEMKFAEYNDIITRRFVEKITVVDSETVLVKIQETDVEIEQSLC
jgi:DNA invertase Pin-like site-specific DNA recombinase